MKNNRKNNNLKQPNQTPKELQTMLTNKGLLKAHIKKYPILTTLEARKWLVDCFLEKIYTEMGDRVWALFRVDNWRTLDVTPIEQSGGCAADSELLIVRKLYFFEGVPEEWQLRNVRFDFIRN